MTIPEKITAYIEHAGLTSLHDFANRAGIPYGTLNNLFHSPEMNITKGTLVKIKSLLGISLDDLVDDDAEIRFTQGAGEGGAGGYPAHTVITIGRGGARTVYQIPAADAEFVDTFLTKMTEKK